MDARYESVARAGRLAGCGVAGHATPRRPRLAAAAVAWARAVSEFGAIVILTYNPTGVASVLSYDRFTGEGLDGTSVAAVLVIRLRPVPLLALRRRRPRERARRAGEVISRRPRHARARLRSLRRQLRAAGRRWHRPRPAGREDHLFESDLPACGARLGERHAPQRRRDAHPRSSGRGHRLSASRSSSAPPSRRTSPTARADPAYAVVRCRASAWRRRADVVRRRHAERRGAADGRHRARSRPSPTSFLPDEPFAAWTRGPGCAGAARSMQREQSLTVLHVTHDFGEGGHAAISPSCWKADGWCRPHRPERSSPSANGGGSRVPRRRERLAGITTPLESATEVEAGVMPFEPAPSLIGLGTRGAPLTP